MRKIALQLLLEYQAIFPLCDHIKFDYNIDVLTSDDIYIYISLRDENCDVSLCQLTYYDNDVWDIFQPNLTNLAPTRNLIK